MKYKTIGIGAQICSGKDTLADYLVSKLGDKWKRNAFANKVKEVFEQSFGKDRAWIEKWKRIDDAPPGFSANIRQCLIGIGDGFRKMKPDIWIERAFENLQNHQIISDVRYTNESKYIRNQREGVTILMWRPGFINNIDSPSEQELMPYIRQCLSAKNYHNSDWYPFEGVINENMGIPFDMFIRNEGDLNDLYRKADEIIIPFLKKKFDIGN